MQASDEGTPQPCRPCTGTVIFRILAFIMTISFIGHGYVGLVTAAVFADLGNTVWVVGRTKEKIERLKKGDPLI